MNKNNTIKLIIKMNTIRQLLEVGGKIEAKLSPLKGRTIVKLVGQKSIDEAVFVMSTYKGDYRIFNKKGELLTVHTL
ncbi:hypothetical protein [Pasteurella phage vB_PmuP_PS07]|nr:hypothetical protein [Pasteurella phage vB_PmuP_PS07]UIS74019.1 hypothetical protein [Pasteurella phage vB_PmuP_PS30]